MTKSGNLHDEAFQGITSLLTVIGEDIDRDGLRESPLRFIKAFKEMTSGYDDDPKAILSKKFEQNFDEMIVLRKIEFTSLCEHHFLPFMGTASIGYIPGESADQPMVVGLSKLARLLDCFARRLQIQERLTNQIADALEAELSPRGIGVVIKAKHLCMITRGVMKQDAEMITSVFRGYLKDRPESRAEFLDHIRE